MDQELAERVASIFGGEAWLKKGAWVVTTYQEDGSIVLISESGVEAFESEEALDAGTAEARVDLAIPDAGDLWVLVDGKGNVYYQDDVLRRGWVCEEDAEQEARGLRSRGGPRYSVVQMTEVSA